MKKFFGAIAGLPPSNPLIGKVIQIQQKQVKVIKHIGEGGFSCIFEVRLCVNANAESCELQQME